MQTRVTYRRLLRLAHALDRTELFETSGSVLNLVQRKKTDFSLMKSIASESGQNTDVNLMYCEAMDLILREPSNHRALTSTIHSLLRGYGNDQNTKYLLQGVVMYLQFLSYRKQRKDEDSEVISERQNRVMQKAMMPYIARLFNISRDIYESADASTKTQLLKLPEVLVLDINEELEKQTLYLGATLPWRMTPSWLQHWNVRISEGPRHMLRHTAERYVSSMPSLARQSYTGQEGHL